MRISKDTLMLALLILGASAIVGGIIVLAIISDQQAREACKRAGGKIICHTSVVNVNGTVGYGEECRCLTSDGREIIDP